MARRIDHWMFESFALTPRSLGVARIIIGAYLVLYRAPELRWIGSLPDPLFRPPVGPMRIVAGIPSSEVATGLSLSLSLTTLALLCGYHTRLASCLTGLLLFTLDGFAYSFGHIHHSGTYLAAVLVVMTGSNWGAAYSVDALRRRSRARPAAQAWPIALAAFLLGFLMLTSALPKLASGWLDPSVLAVRSHVVHYQVVAPGEGLLGSLTHELTSSLMWKPLDYLTLVFEVGFVIAIVSPRWTRIFCSVAVAFHLAIFLLFGISFTRNVVAYAIFFQWSAVVDRLGVRSTLRLAGANPTRLRSRVSALIGPAVLLGGVALYLLTEQVGAPIRRLAPRVVANPDQAASLFVFGVAILLATAYLVAELKHGITRIARRGTPEAPASTFVSPVAECAGGSGARRRARAESVSLVRNGADL